MVIAGLFGGMGNQMFQYAMARHISIRNGTELRLDNSIHRNFYPNRHIENFKKELAHFEIEAPYLSDSETNRFHTLHLNFAGKVLFHLRKRIFGDQVTHEKGYNFDPQYLTIHGAAYLSGLWQSYKYFEAISPTIKKDFSLRNTALKDRLDHIWRDFSGKIPTVAVHVRRTDYLNDPDMFFLGREYYDRAFKFMTSKFEEVQFCIFSDDIRWCKQNFENHDGRFSFISGDISKSAIEDFYLMQLCDHNIIANSTFSWWSAWLNDGARKIVVAPALWFRNGADTSDLIPSGWERL